MKARIEAVRARVDTITARMAVQKPFLAAVFSRLDRIILSDPSGTAATDGHKAWFCVEHCEMLNNDELLTLGMHEASHVAYMHPWRRENRRPDMFNKAGDYVIDTPLIAEGWKHHKSWLVPESWVTRDMSTEDVYARLMQNPPPEPPPSPQSSNMLEPGDGGSGGKPTPGDGPTGDAEYNACVKGGGDVGDAPDGATEADMEAAILSAAQMAKACGDDSAMVDFIIGGGLRPSIGWTEVLRQVMTAADRSDYTFGRMNKRYISSGVYMPSLYAEAMGGLVVAMDTSISMSKAELEQAGSEITAIFEDCNPEWVEFVPCSTSVGRVTRFERGDPVKLECEGRGGTRFKPVFDYIADMQDRAAALIYFTDLEGDLNEIPPPEYPVVWGMTGRRDIKVPFGEVVKVVI